MNPNNRGAGTPAPPHPEFGGPTAAMAPGEKRPVPAGAAVREGVIVQKTMRGGRAFIRMRPQGG